MTYSALEVALIKLLGDRIHNGLSFSEICSILRLSRNEKGLLSNLLNDQLILGKLVKDKKKYYSKSKVQLAPNSKNTNESKFVNGVFDATPLSRNLSFAFVRATDRDYYIDSEDTLNAFHGDTVLIDVKSNRRHENYGVIRKVITRANPNISGDLSKIHGRWVFIPSNPKIHKWFEIVNIGDGKEGFKCILTVINWGNPLLGASPVGNITEVLGLSGDPQVELLAVIRQYNLPLQFPPQVLQEIESVSSTIENTEIANRLDLRKFYTFTIDPVSAKDFDDAISIEKMGSGWRLWVHIADVSHYLKTSSSAFKEALLRGNSFYFPKKVIPMIPERLSNLICSLRPDEDKLCLSVITDFDDLGNVINQSIHESIIRSNIRLTYREVDDFFNGVNADLPHTLHSSLNDGRELSSILTKKRIREGYVFFDLPDVEYEYDQEGFVRRIEVSEETESHKLIENFMLVANEFVASKLNSKCQLAVFRIHENPDPEKISRVCNLLRIYGIEINPHNDPNKFVQNILSALPNDDFHIVFDKIVLRSMKKAKYSPRCSRHFGLSIECYTQFTSPIRRICDLVVHHMCKQVLIHNRVREFDDQQLKMIAEIASERESLADSAERDIENVYSLRFMKDKIGQAFSGIVVLIRNTSIHVRLRDFPISGIVDRHSLGKGSWSFIEEEMRMINTKSGVYFQLLDQVCVKVVDVKHDILFEMHDLNNSHLHAIKCNPFSTRNKTSNLDELNTSKNSDLKIRRRRKEKK